MQRDASVGVGVCVCVCLNLKVAFTQAVMQYIMSFVPVAAIWKDRKFSIEIA